MALNYVFCYYVSIHILGKTVFLDLHRFFLMNHQ